MRPLCTPWLLRFAHVLKLMKFYRSRCAKILLQVGCDACFVIMWKQIVILSSAVFPMHSFSRTYRDISSGWLGSGYSWYYICHCSSSEELIFFLSCKNWNNVQYLAHRRFRAPRMYCHLQDMCWFMVLASACKFHGLESTWRKEIWRQSFTSVSSLVAISITKNSRMNLLQSLSGNWGINRSQITCLLGALFGQHKMSLTALLILYYIASDSILFGNVMTFWQT